MLLQSHAERAHLSNAEDREQGEQLERQESDCRGLSEDADRARAPVRSHSPVCGFGHLMRAPKLRRVAELKKEKRQRGRGADTVTVDLRRSTEAVADWLARFFISSLL